MLWKVHLFATNFCPFVHLACARIHDSLLNANHYVITIQPIFTQYVFVSKLPLHVFQIIDDVAVGVTRNAAGGAVIGLSEQDFPMFCEIGKFIFKLSLFYYFFVTKQDWLGILSTTLFVHFLSFSVNIQWNSVITYKFLSKIGHISTKINPVITNKNVRSRAVRYNRVWLYLTFWHTYLFASLRNLCC